MGSTLKAIVTSKENRFGKIVIAIMTIIFILNVVLSFSECNLFWLLLSGGGYMYGASPAIFACIGVLANWLLRKRVLWNEYKAQRGFRFVLYYFILSNFLSLHTFLVHLLGFCVGFLFGFVVREKRQ